MCGIAGWLRPGGQRDNEAWADELQRMVGAILHRGPDAGGTWFGGPVAFGHRRLSIVDPTPVSDQPMTDPQSGNVILFNGEIYNFIELREELQTLGVHFSTKGDTEVILKAYQVWGLEECLERLCGMFAFALWDQSLQMLFLCRDRLGKKPFFYCELPQSSGGGVLFASEPQAILAHPGMSHRANVSAFRKFLILGYSTGEETLSHGVKRLLPGHIMTVNTQGNMTSRPYYDLLPAFQVKTGSSEEECLVQLDEMMDLVVGQRLRADVPFGMFLSGGIDSNTVLAYMLKHLGPEKTQTFSIGFSERSYDESGVAEAVAAHFGTKHQTFRVTHLDEDLDKIISKAADEPLADASFIPTYRLAQKTADQNIKMVLTGDGGDELFAGYPTYVADKLHRGLSHILPTAAWSGVYSLADRVLPVSHKRMSLDFKLRQFLRGMSLDPARAHFSWRVLQTQNVWRSLLHPDLARDCSWDEVFSEFEPHYSKSKALDPLDQALYVDTKTWLVDSVLVKVDRATMANGLEARSPLLDHRLAEFAAKLPVDMKLRGFKGKWILRQLAASRVPDTVMKQPKRGFSVPISSWFGKEGLKIVEDSLFASMRAGYFNNQALLSLYEEHRQGKFDHGLTLFNIIIASKWLQKHQ